MSESMPTREEMLALADGLLNTPLTKPEAREVAFNAASALRALAQPAETPTREAVAALLMALEEAPYDYAKRLSWAEGIISAYAPGRQGQEWEGTVHQFLHAADAIHALYAPFLAAREEQPAGLREAEPVVFTYRNWRGVTAERRVLPISIRFGATEWHPEPQWLLRASDLDKGEEREFAMADISSPEALAAARAEGAREMREAAVAKAHEIEKYLAAGGELWMASAAYNVARSLAALPLPDASPRAEEPCSHANVWPCASRLPGKNLFKCEDCGQRFDSEEDVVRARAAQDEEGAVMERYYPPDGSSVWSPPIEPALRSRIAALEAENARLKEENFALAADVCEGGYAGEHGHHRCRLVDAAEARASDLERRLIEAVEVCRGLLTWAEKKCPCRDEGPDPCPLCGARVDATDENGVCKAADYTIPRDLLDKARRASLTGAPDNG